MPVRLRGINRSGLEYSKSLVQAGITEREFDEIILIWGANVVRIPFTQSFALTDSSYLVALDTAIQMATERGAYTILDLQWLDDLTHVVPALPNRESITLWSELAHRYRSNPAVLYDIFNEPHDVTMKEWRPWATELISAVRTQNPSALIFVSGLNWGFDLRGYPLPGITGIVYSTHVYRNKGKAWRKAFGRLAQELPVFVAEWGGTNADLDWGDSLLNYLDSLNIGWAAWSWSDHPHLTKKTDGPRYEATEFGWLVRKALQGQIRA